MKKNTSNKLIERLSKYGALSLAIAGVADATGQVIYTDITDFVGGATDVLAIDFDGDATDDISIIQTNSGGGAERVKFESPAGNGAIGTINGPYFYASNLIFGAVIDSAGAFYNSGSFCYGVGYAGSQFCASTDGYIGVQFAIGTNTHYGWVRLDVADNSNFVVKDYAYEATPDTQILAGDNALSVDEFELRRITHFYDTDTNILTLDSQTPLNQMTVYNILGQEALKVGLLDSQHSETNMSGLQAGIYIAKIIGHNNASKTIKLVIK